LFFITVLNLSLGVIAKFPKKMELKLGFMLIWMLFDSQISWVLNILSFGYGMSSHFELSSLIWLLIIIDALPKYIL
jgi:hypothetical protein